MVCCAVSQAQKISFKQSTVNTSTTLWKSPVTATFSFTNKGKAPLVIKDVDPGCGCMTPTWTQGDIAKGAWGEIKVTYDAKMLGHFDRYIDVYTNASSKPVRVRMKGIVSTKLELNVDSLFPYKIDNVAVNTNNIEFPDLHAGDSAKTSILIYNSGDKVYVPQLMHLPPYITMSVRPEKIGRDNFGTIELTAHGADVPELGLTQTSIYVPRFPGDKVGTDNEISVSIVKLSEQKPVSNGKLTPKMQLSTTDLVLKKASTLTNVAKKLGIKTNVLGKVTSKAKMHGKVTITNKGLAPLNLTNIQSFNQAITISVPKTTIGPGESVDMKITVDNRFLGVSKAQPRVLLITDDPKYPKAVINVKFD